MPVFIENLLCFGGLTLCAIPAVAMRIPLTAAIFIILCAVQPLLYKKMYTGLRVKQVLAYESVYIMLNFLLALVFRLIVRAASPQNIIGAYTAFMFFVVFNTFHLATMIIYLILKRRAMGPEPKNPEDYRYGIIQDDEVENTM